MSVEPPPPPQVSPDGLFYWDGQRWMPMPVAASREVQRSAQPPTTARPSYVPVATHDPVPSGVAEDSLRSGLATSGGIIGIGAAFALLVGCILPYEHCVPNATAGCWTQWPSLFIAGYPGAWANAANAALQVVLALGVSILIITWMNWTARAFLSGALLCIGVLNLVGFFALAVGISADGMEVAAGTVIAVLGSAAFTLGGALSALSLRARQDTHPAISSLS